MLICTLQLMDILGITSIIGTLAAISVLISMSKDEAHTDLVIDTYIDPGPLPDEDPKIWVGKPGKGNYCIMIPIERDDESYAGAGGLSQCTCFSTREEAVAASLDKYN